MLLKMFQLQRYLLKLSDGVCCFVKSDQTLLLAIILAFVMASSRNNLIFSLQNRMLITCLRTQDCTAIMQQFLIFAQTEYR